jgi:hypothetical protein
VSAKQGFSLKPRLCRFDFRRCFHSGICSRINSSGNIILCFRYRGGQMHASRKIASEYVSRLLFIFFAFMEFRAVI